LFRRKDKCQLRNLSAQRSFFTSFFSHTHAIQPQKYKIFFKPQLFCAIIFTKKSCRIAPTAFFLVLRIQD